MVKSSKKVLAVLLAVACLITFMPAMASQSFAAKKLTVKPAKKTIYVKKSVTLKANQKVKWSASKASLKVVKLTSKKAKSVKVTGKKAGKAVVTAKVGKQTKKVTITVKKAKAAVKKTAVTAVALSADNAADPAKEVKVGTKLRAAVTPENATVTYQWKADGTAIAGATGSTFTVTTAEIGKAITVEATGTGSFEKTAVSAATAKVSAVTINSITMGKAEIVSKKTEYTGATNNVNAGEVLGLVSEVTGSTLENAADIQWYRVGTASNGTATEDAIEGANGVTYTVTKDDIGYQICVKVTPKAGVSVASTSGLIKKSTDTAYTIGTTTGKVHGEIKVKYMAAGKEVGAAALNTALTAEVTPADAAVDFQWYKDGVKVAGATSATYTPTAAGQYTVKLTLKSTERTYNLGTSGTTAITEKTFTPGVNVGSATFSSLTLKNTNAETRKDSNTLPSDEIRISAPVMGGNATFTYVVKDKDGNDVSGYAATDNKTQSDAFNVPAGAKVGDTYTITAKGTKDTVNKVDYSGCEATATVTVNKAGAITVEENALTKVSGTDGKVAGLSLNLNSLGDAVYGKDYTVSFAKAPATTYGTPVAMAGDSKYNETEKTVTYEFVVGDEKDANNGYVAIITETNGSQYVIGTQYVSVK